MLRGTIQPLIIFSPEVTEGAVHFTARLDGPTSDFYMELAPLPPQYIYIYILGSYTHEKKKTISFLVGLRLTTAPMVI